MVILAGILQPIHEMNMPMKLLAQAMPSRWAFEGLPLLEIEDRPKRTPPVLPAKALAQLPAQGVATATGPETLDTKGSVVKLSRVGTAQDSKESATKPASAAAAPAEAERPKKQEMAERYFPQEEERMGKAIVR